MNYFIQEGKKKGSYLVQSGTIKYHEGGKKPKAFAQAFKGSKASFFALGMLNILKINQHVSEEKIDVSVQIGIAFGIGASGC